MYIPPQFEQPGLEAMHALMLKRPLATLVTLSAEGLNANHIPLLFSKTASGCAVLRGHVARANPICRDLSGKTEALAIFHGPDAYISPSWYASKQETHKVVPTWNYAVVHAYGSLRFIEDAAWLRRQLEDLTNQHEAGFDPPWALSDAPADFIEKLTEAIIGVEMAVTRLSGKWKLSQNQPPENQASVIDGLKQAGMAEAAAWVELGFKAP